MNEHARAGLNRRLKHNMCRTSSTSQVFLRRACINGSFRESVRVMRVEVRYKTRGEELHTASNMRDEQRAVFLAAAAPLIRQPPRYQALH
jgi:hypothetical protein